MSTLRASHFRPIAAQALLLAAGRGERMRPLTDHCPKPLLPLRGKPLMQWAMEGLQRGGVTDLVINTAWLGQQIPAHFGEVFEGAGTAPMGWILGARSKQPAASCAPCRIWRRCFGSPQAMCLRRTLRFLPKRWPATISNCLPRTGLAWLAITPSV